VLDADTVEWFKQHGGLKRENGDRFREMLLSRADPPMPSGYLRILSVAIPT
jgi:peptidyl-dipeptidase Dcp